MLKAEVTDIGTAIPSANIFLKDKEYIFPKGLPKIIEGLEFTKIMKGSNGLKQLCSKGKGTIYIAFSDPNYNSEEWTNLKQNFVVNSETFHLYSYSYKKPETWVNIPQLQKPGTILFAENLELTDTNPPGVVICESNDPKLYFVTDPCIAILPNGKYIAGCRSKFDGKKATYRIFGSTDKGETWQKITDLDEVGFCSLFTHNGELYVMGTKGGFNHAIIRKSVDGGQTWTTPTDHKNGLLMGRSKSFHSASVPVVINNGRIWRAMEDNIPFGDRNFRAFLMSAPVNANLLDSSSWTCTVPLPYQKDWLGEERTFKGWFEGNAVVKPDGSMANFLRIEEQTYDGKAAMIHIAPDGVSASFDPKKDIIDFPGASKKFVIRYDSISSKYWSITNHTFDQDRGKEHCGLTRNRVVLVWSQDLRNWAISDTLISINDPHFHGYQYIDWLIDGNDIVAVSRTAHDYRKGLPVRQHDANYLTFHRFMNFRN
ncbi:MAG: hypothetical protein A2W90_23245 [Bacteroidetes bacterium GWF2_42_66]|nr:MAG: hypothetical protein A2W92_03055 [Bacteroidetes bacterium GWA2_42_15]OFY00420.1 MAG: hypothetical protein A2W89_14420 [Bacteroidetes bacterium GWE2_42_39]OFY47196.1 MAG: hypothetical protein A2W90_23245 [Bacteroidetes bacterium GWF2_42_66]